MCVGQNEGLQISSQLCIAEILGQQDVHRTRSFPGFGIALMINFFIIAKSRRLRLIHCIGQ